jgi:hypothetical protein
MRDQDQLARALDQGGLPAEQRTIQFRLAEPPAPTPQGGQGQPQQQDTPRPQSQGQPGFDTSGSAMSQRQDGQGGSRQGPRRPPGAPDSLGLEADTFSAPAAARLMRLRGIDITA